MNQNDWEAYGTSEPIYHMCKLIDYNNTINQNKLYYPPTYEIDGFIHATANPLDLIDVANHFYQNTIGDWICLKIHKDLLDCKVIYESPAPVGDIEAVQTSNEIKFPHIYGGIPKKSIINIYKINRDTNGLFLSIEGLV